MPPDTFETARLLLRPVSILDVDAIFGSYAQDEEVVRYLVWRPHRSRSETQAYVDRCIATPSEVERTYMLLGREDNIVRGAFALRPFADDLGGSLAELNAPAGFRTTTIESKTNIFRACGPERLTAVAVPVHVGRRMIVLQTSIYRADGKLAAMMIQTQMVLPRESTTSAGEGGDEV